MSDLRHSMMDDGCRIAFEYLEQPGAPGLVFSPSLGTSMGLFDAQVQAFSERYSILRYDPRGHGASDVAEGSYSHDRLGRAGQSGSQQCSRTGWSRWSSR